MSETGRLSDVIDARLADSPTDQCIWWREAWWSRGAFAELVDASAKALASCGFSPRMTIALLMNNSPRMLAACCAAWRLGGRVAPVSTALKTSDAIAFIDGVGAFGAIVDDDLAHRMDKLAAANIPCARASSLDGGRMEMDGRHIASGDIGAAAVLRAARRGGKPRYVPLTHSNILTLIDALRGEIDELSDDDVVLNSVSDSTALGLVVCGIMPLADGRPQVAVSALAPPERIAQCIRRSGATVVPTMARMLELMLEMKDASPFTKIKLLFCGGELSPATIQRARTIFGADPLQAWGLTETSGVFAVTPPGRGRPGTSGRVLSCFEVESRGGRIFTRGQAVSEACLGSDGWLDTGITAAVDDGYITIFG